MSLFGKNPVLGLAECLHRAWLSAKAIEINEKRIEDAKAIEINEKRIEDAKAAAGVTEETATWSEWKKLGYEVIHGSKALFGCDLIWGSFVFRNRKGKFFDYASIDYKLKHIIIRYNKEHKDKLPDISCHTFRHNFCCWLCENVEGTNSADDIKYIQSIMGHSDAAITLNIYSQLRKANQSGKHEALKRKAQG